MPTNRANAFWELGYEADFGVTGPYSADIEAINDYIMRSQAVTPDAVKVKDDWVKWYDSLWFATQSNFDIARNKRLAFNLANAKTAKEKAAVKDHATKGMSAEQLKGQPDRRLSTGEYTSTETPTYLKYGLAAGAGAVALAAALLYLKKVMP